MSLKFKKKAISTTLCNLCREFCNICCQTGAVEMLPLLNNKTVKRLSLNASYSYIKIYKIFICSNVGGNDLVVAPCTGIYCIYLHIKNLNYSILTELDL